jgi:hypothetical protein
MVEGGLGRVIIGMDPHKRSATVEIVNDREKVLARGRFGSDRDGYQAMLKLGREHKDRIWAVEGCNGIGRHVAQRLVAEGQTVLDVPAKLSARARLFDTAQARKTDPVDAHCVAVAALRPPWPKYGVPKTRPTPSSRRYGSPTCTARSAGWSAQRCRGSRRPTPGWPGSAATLPGPHRSRTCHSVTGQGAATPAPSGRRACCGGRPDYRPQELGYRL